MIEPTSVTDQMMYCTVRIVGRIAGTTNFKTGTGFFYNLRMPDGGIAPILITNNHVIDGTDTLEFRMHATTEKDAKMPDAQVIIRSVQADWVPHPNPKIDLCALVIGPVSQTTRPFIFFRALDPTFVKSQSELLELTAVEDILMVGYPNGLWDATNNYPLIRRGITASHPAVDFDVNGVGCTVIDIASFPGSSGSPVFIYNSGVVTDRKGQMNITSRVILLGVLFSGPTFQSDGKIVIRNIPTVDTPVPQMNLMMNLGYIIKAREIATLGEAIFSRFGVK